MTDVPAPQPWNNGLLASSYVELTDVPAPVAPQLLNALSRSRIAAYLAEAPGSTGALRLYVAASERSDARTIVAAVLRANGTPQPGADTPATPPVDPLAGIDADAAFAAIVADWHIDTHTAIRDAERALSREDEDWRQRLNQPDEAGPAAEDLTWLDDEHYVPPTPPPIPRPTAPIVLGMLLVLCSILLFAFGGFLGLPFTVSFFLGVAGIVAALVLFVMRLREYRDEDDDGAVI